MENASISRALLVAEGSGGHLVPALLVAEALAKAGADVKLWYAHRAPMAELARALTQDRKGLEIVPMPVEARGRLVSRLRQGAALWRQAERCFETFTPEVVVGFGGWVSAPVLLAASRRRIRCLVHEQNVTLGRANRFLARRVDRVALSFRDTHAIPGRTPSLVTGMPVRQEIGASSRLLAAKRFGLSPERPTVVILGGSQGARAINRLMMETVGHLRADERTWQFLHLTGSSDVEAIRQAYASAGLAAWVAPFLVDMEDAYAHADLVVARAGASTIAELARCGRPAVLIPYPHAHGHQRANAALVDAVGGGVVIEESAATPERLLGALRRLLGDRRLRDMMSGQMRRLDNPDALERLTEAIAQRRR